MQLSKNDEVFLKNYNPEKYQKPSVTTDILIFTISENNELQLLLIKRKKPPFENCWAIPGGFVNMDESLDEAAKRELKEETNLDNIAVEQLYTFGDVGRDPRMRVISVAYYALVGKKKLMPAAGDDAEETRWVSVSLKEGKLVCEDNIELAFDHSLIVETAIRRLIGKLSYTTIAISLLENDQRFTIAQLRTVYEAILQKKLDIANFRRDFKRIYEDGGIVEETGELDHTMSKRPGKTYRIIRKK